MIIGILVPPSFGIILLLYRGCLLSEVKLYCHGPVIELVLIERSNVLCSLFGGSFKRGSIVYSTGGLYCIVLYWAGSTADMPRGLKCSNLQINTYI